MEKKNILVFKSYAGLGDIFFAIPSILSLKDYFESVTFAIQPRLVSFFRKNLEGITVVDEEQIDLNAFDQVIELGNYPWFQNDKEKIPQIPYPTHKKVKQHAIEHYRDGILAQFDFLPKENIKHQPYPYFKRNDSKELYYTLHAGAGFLLKAWPNSYFAKLIELIHELYPQLKVKIIVGKNDPNPQELVSVKGIESEIVDGGIEEVADVISSSQFHIGNDSGITHLAGAFNTPILTIYGPTGPGSWGAFSENVELIWGKKGNCQIRCKYDVVMNCKDRVCLSNVKPEMMLFHLMKLLDKLNFSKSHLFLPNPYFTPTIEDNYFLFKSSENEYLLEVSDNESFVFLENALAIHQLDMNCAPSNFKKALTTLVDLGVFQNIPEIKTEETCKL